MLSNLDAPWGEVPGTAVERDALGYMHANCGHCHSATEDGIVFPGDLDLMLSVHDTEVELTDAYVTAVNQPNTSFTWYPEIPARIVPQDIAASSIYHRLATRGGDGLAPSGETYLELPYDQMPPLATEVLDEAGMAMLEAWINSL
jgi:hypothetical protein